MLDRSPVLSAPVLDRIRANGSCPDWLIIPEWSLIPIWELPALLSGCKIRDQLLLITQGHGEWEIYCQDFCFNCPASVQWSIALGDIQIRLNVAIHTSSAVSIDNILKEKHDYFSKFFWDYLEWLNSNEIKWKINWWVEAIIKNVLSTMHSTDFFIQEDAENFDMTNYLFLIKYINNAIFAIELLKRYRELVTNHPELLIEPKELSPHEAPAQGNLYWLRDFLKKYEILG